MVHWRSRRRLSLLRTRRMRISDAAGQWCFVGIHVSNKANAPVIRPGGYAQSRLAAIHRVVYAARSLQSDADAKWYGEGKQGLAD